MLAKLPPLLQRVNELGKICAIEQPFFVRLADDVQRVLAEQYPLLCGDYGFSRWEKLLGILPARAAGDEERLRAILFRLNEQLPFTYAKLKELIALVSPAGEYSIEFLAEEKRLVVKVSLVCKRSEQLLCEVLSRTLPANILWELQWYYNTHGKLIGYTHSELAELTHYKIKEEVLP